MTTAKERLLAKINASKNTTTPTNEAPKVETKATTTQSPALQKLLAKKKPTQAPINPTIPETAKVAPVSEAKQKLLGSINRKPMTTKMIDTTKVSDAPQKLSESEQAALDSLMLVSKELDALEEFDADKFVSMLPKLKENIEAKAPGIANYLREILNNLNKYPELTHLLNDDQLSIIYSGMLYQTNTEIATTKSGSRSKKKLTLDEAIAIF